MRLLATVLLGSVAVLSCGGDDGDGNGLGELDPRCGALCDEEDAACSDEVTECEQLCQVRIAGVASPCATCLMENAHLGDCGGGGPCCPDPDFETSVLDCAALCADSEGLNPTGDHPVCVSLCSSEDPACASDAGQCLDECQARIDGVSGLCATCLLEGASGGDCGGGGPCCPDIQFWNSPVDCAALCSGS